MEFVVGESPELMPDILWEDVAAFFEIDGSVKLIYVEAAGSMTIWQALVEWVSTRGPDHRYTETGAAGPVVARPATDEIFGRRSRLAKPHLQSLSGWIAPGIQAWLCRAYLAIRPGDRTFPEPPASITEAACVLPLAP